jgi:hypothetical protein
MVVDPERDRLAHLRVREIMDIDTDGVGCGPVLRPLLARFPTTDG